MAHKLAFALLKTNAQGNKDIEQYLFEHERSLVVIEETIPADNAHGLMMLREGYIKFWLHFAHTSLDEMQKNESKRKKKWRSLLLQMLTARKNLQQQGYLPENFVIDKKYLMMERFENYIHAAYRNTLWTLGDDRVEQINFLRQQLQNTHSEMQAARLIHIAIEDIQQDHQEKSFGFNLAFVKKKSRAAGALQALLRDCEKEGVLPKIAMRHVGPVGQHLAKVVEDYFSAAILFSNRDHRSIAKRLFSAIRLVEDQINEEKILFIDGQQLIADLLEHAIKEVKKMDKQNNLVNKILNYLGSQTNPAFVEYLKRAQTELLLTKKLVESYRYVIWPIVREKLNSALNTYKNTITPEYDEDKEKGVREANEMIIQLQDATNAEHVCYLLAYAIRSFQTGFPMLAQTLEETYQILRKDGVLPSIAHTEFSETIKKQIKQQTRDITELRARLCKVS